MLCKCKVIKPLKCPLLTYYFISSNSHVLYNLNFFVLFNRIFLPWCTLKTLCDNFVMYNASFLFVYVVSSVRTVFKPKRRCLARMEHNSKCTVDVFNHAAFCSVIQLSKVISDEQI